MVSVLLTKTSIHSADTDKQRGDCAFLNFASPTRLTRLEIIRTECGVLSVQGLKDRYMQTEIHCMGDCVMLKREAFGVWNLSSVPMRL